MTSQAMIAALAALAAAGCAPLSASAPVRPAVAPPAADLAAIDSTIDRVYAVISGPIGQPRDWEAMRTLFVPGAQMSAIGPKGIRSFTLDEYIKSSGPILVQHGFTEQELARRVEVYGNIAHAWSSYAGTTADNSLSVRGINSIQLARDPRGRWLVQSIFWQPETPAIPLPADMER